MKMLTSIRYDKTITLDKYLQHKLIVKKLNFYSDQYQKIQEDIEFWI